MNIKHILLALTGALLSAAHVSAQTWTAPEVGGSSDPVSGQVYQVRNVESGWFLAGGTSWYSWNTSTVLVDPSVATPLSFTLTEEIDNFGNSLGWTFARTTDGRHTFISAPSPQGLEGYGEMHVDMNSQGHDHFELLPQGNGNYYIRAVESDELYGSSMDGYYEKYWGWQGSDSPYPTAVYATVRPSDGFYCDWQFVGENDMAVYQARLRLYNLTADIDQESLGIDYQPYYSAYVSNDLDALNQAIAELKAQIQQARATQLAQGASAENPVDFTSLLENPSFDMGNISGWTCTFQKNVNSDNPGYQGNRPYTNGSVQISQFIEAWTNNNYNTNRSFAALGDGELSQGINGLPAGLYTLECYAIAVQQYQTSENPVEGVELFATDSNGEQIQELATGNRIPEHFKLTFTTDGGYINLGLRTRNTSANWIAADNFRLTYYGNDDAHTLVVNEFRQVAQEGERLLSLAQSNATGEYEATGLVTSASQLSSPYTETREGSIEALLDGSTTTYWHSDWSQGSVPNGTHYLQVEMTDLSASDIIMAFSRRPSRNDHVTEWAVYGTNDYNAAKEDCYFLATLLTPYVINTETLYSTLFNTQGYQYLRFYIQGTTSDRGYGHMSEFQLYPATAFQYLHDATGDTGTRLNTLVNLSDEYITSDKIDELRTTISDYKKAINAALAEPHKIQTETPQEPQNLDFAWDEPIDNGICTSANDATTNGTPYSGALPVSAWKVKEDPGYRAGGVFAYGSSPFLGGPGYVAPSTGPADSNGQALGLVAAWTATLQYTQYVELPAGNYTLRVPVYNAGGTDSVVRNLIGFLADNGIEYLATRTSYPVGEWVVEEIHLNLAEPTIGHLSLGYVSDDQGSGSMPHLFIDRMELASNDGQHEYVATVENRVDIQAYIDKWGWGYNINTDEIKSALGISSLAEARRYAVNADGSWQEDTTNGWRDADGNVCPYDQISGRGMQVTHQDEWEENYYEVQAYPGSNYTPDETYTAQFAYEYGEQAVLLNIIIDFNRYESTDQTGTIAFEGIENNCVRVRLNSTEKTEVTIPETDGSLSVTGLASRAFAEAPNLKSIILPASITDVPIDAFEGCRAPAITWQSTSTALPANAFQNVYGIGTANMLFYVKNRNLAPSGVGNVVVEGATDNVVNLTDNRSPFYCPQQFTAQTVSYAHTYGMNTGLEGNAAGWETITLPFDVTEIEYNGKKLESFNTWNANKSTIPFWLYEFSPNGFAPASYIRANTPYIVAMPNNAAYDDKYNINGEVTFKGTTVRASNGMSGTQQGDKVFSPNYDELQANATLFVINSNSQAFGDRSGGEKPGSKFVAQAGDAHPFEAFFKVSGNNVKGESIAIEFSDATALPQVPFDARLLPQDGAAVYNLSGQLVRRASTAADARQLLRGLPAGIYVVNGRKVVVGK